MVHVRSNIGHASCSLPSERLLLWKCEGCYDGVSSGVRRAPASLVQ